MNIQRAIVNALHLVEGTALEVMHIFVDQEAKWEQMCKDPLEEQVNKVVDAGHGVDNGESCDFNSNLDG